MQTYVEKLLQLQMQQAARLTERQNMELPQYSAQLLRLRQQNTENEEKVQSEAEREAERQEMRKRPGQEDTQGAAALLEELESMQAANDGAQAESRTETAAMMRNLAAQSADVLTRTQLLQERIQPAGVSQMLPAGGIAAKPTERSMQEISRFFERDARRYG
ncbi:MAG: hypothetical protein MJ118_05970 [Clostridia bacterium]|nr:hypothetical protein [Clostridia bacterium]